MYLTLNYADVSPHIFTSNFSAIHKSIDDTVIAIREVQVLFYK